MHELIWRLRYAAWMWWDVQWISWGDAWEAAWAFEFEQVEGCSPRDAVHEELSYWTE